MLENKNPEVSAIAAEQKQENRRGNSGGEAGKVFQKCE